MTVKDRESFEKARAHAAAARQEFKAMCKVLGQKQARIFAAVLHLTCTQKPKLLTDKWKVLLPEAFWQHAQESKVEAKAAVTAFRRAAKRQCAAFRKRPSRLREKIEIA